MVDACFGNTADESDICCCDECNDHLDYYKSSTYLNKKKENKKKAKRTPIPPISGLGCTSGKYVQFGMLCDAMVENGVRKASSNG